MKCKCKNTRFRTKNKRLGLYACRKCGMLYQNGEPLEPTVKLENQAVVMTAANFDLQTFLATGKVQEKPVVEQAEFAPVKGADQTSVIVYSQLPWQPVVKKKGLMDRILGAVKLFMA